LAKTGAFDVMSKALMTLAGLIRDATVAYGDMLRVFGVRFNAQDIISGLSGEVAKQLEKERKNLEQLKGKGVGGFFNNLLLDDEALKKQTDRSISEIKRLESNLERLKKTYDENGQAILPEKPPQPPIVFKNFENPENNSFKEIKTGFDEIKDKAKATSDEMGGYFNSFADELARGITSGANAWDVFKMAGMRALQDIASQQISGIFKGESSGGGGIFGDVFSSIGGGLKDILPSFDTGGYTGTRSGGGVDGKGGFPAILHPEEMVLNKKQMSSMGGSGGGASVTQFVNLQATSDKDIQRVVMSMMPRFIEAAQSAVNTSIASGGETSRLIGLRR
jgi:hypothetical protein